MTSTQVFGNTRLRAVPSVETIDFESIEELCAFVQGEIQRSKLRYITLATRADVCASTVSNLAHGITHQPRASTCFGILRALGWTIQAVRT